MSAFVQFPRFTFLHCASTREVDKPSSCFHCYNTLMISFFHCSNTLINSHLFSTISPSRAADGILLVFSLDDPKSFDEVTHLHNQPFSVSIDVDSYSVLVAGFFHYWPNLLAGGQTSRVDSRKQCQSSDGKTALFLMEIIFFKLSHGHLYIIGFC